MGTTFRTSLVLVATLTACGTRVTVNDDREPTAPPSPTTPPTAEPDPSPTPTGRCGVPESEPVMTLHDGEGLAILYADGTSRALDVGFDALPEGNRTLRSLADGGHVATFASSIQVNGGIEADSVVSLFDAQGTLLWRMDGPGYVAGGVALADDGTLLMSRSFYDPDFGGDDVVVRDGVIEPVPSDLSLIHGGWVADGIVRATYGGAPAFYDVNAGVTTIVASAEGAIWSQAFDQGFLSLHEGKSVPWLFVDRYGDSQLLTLDGIDEAAAALVRVAATGEHVLLRSQDTLRHWRVALASGDAIELPSSTPLGPPPDEMSYCSPPPSLGSTGEVLMVGGQQTLSFQSFDPATNAWATLGQPVNHVETTSAFERDGTWILNGVVGTFCPGPVGEGDVGLAGVSTQVVSVELGAHHVIDAWDYADVAEGGTCVGYVNDEGVHLLDLLTAETTLVGEGGFSWWPSPD